VSPKHYQHVRRIAATRDVPPPTIATVYGSIEQDPCCSVSNIQLCYLSTQPHVFPETFLPNTVMLIVDTGASVSIMPDAADFVEPPKSVQPTILQGIASDLQVKGIGTMLYIFIDEEGTEVTILLPHTLYVPGCATRLLCPRHLVETTQVPNDGFFSLQNHATLKCHGKSILVEYNSTTGLPIVHVRIKPQPKSPCPGSQFLFTAQHGTSTLDISARHPTLSNSQRLKLLWHERCNHRSMATINTWIRRGLLPVDSEWLHPRIQFALPARQVRPEQRRTINIQTLLLLPTPSQAKV